MKILLGGIPLGCENIGDEAILACVIGIFRRCAPEAELAVCTRDREGTERKFGVKTFPAYGFDPALTIDGFDEIVKDFDWFVWAGATGLSDYPAMGCRLLEGARRGGVKTIVWNVGMNDTFNPAFFTIRGKKKMLCDFVRRAFGFDLLPRWEKYLAAEIRQVIARELSTCKLIVLRDADSLAELRKCAPFPDARVGADSAILLEGVSQLPWASEEEAQRFAAAEKRIALCISAQSPVRDLAAMARWMEEKAKEDARILWVMIPMNPRTDYELMARLQKMFARPERSLLLAGFHEPEEVQTVVGQCQLVVASRLHLMILGLNRLVPGIGIARGSKITTSLAAFGLPTCGSTEAPDYVALSKEVPRFLEGDAAFCANAAAVREAMLKRLADAEDVLRNVLSS